ncbi:hypothetical protein AUJ84_00875 [Candidatus Pacearchaeota archaeon CG1_02_32_132]|nr:MAG: hypothetical protein AUJ84_00875 [Candidatus Pacearchaeota archaeon CG1_02_32_132]
MTLTSEQIKELKKQLSEQIKHLPPEEKTEAQKQIDEMSSQALETMLKQQQSASSIFRKIVSKEIPSKIIDESPDALAVLEIRPISKGHIIVIPKKAISEAKDVSKKILDFSQKIADKLSKTLKIEKIEIQSSSQLGEVIINLIPIYDKPLDINSPRIQEAEEELEKIHTKIISFKEIKKETKVVKKPVKKKIHILKIKRRIP